ncbi:AlbA family DNA-binding domain-containing protein [Ligilactobacillus aviarius]|uniref:AlbA family DNA-binding domain-containing protein n=1 Tax=Ligilactobacillus aviarius TaxID=1606 RepID=UPI0024BBE3F4|nr:RNA-binding domain-containing protein [Ligilactobacillus aviarius]
MKTLPPENIHTEYKESKKNIPNDMWETVSAFANTEGGNIFLGIKEIKHENGFKEFIPQGVKNIEKQKEDLLNTVKDKSKISIPAFKEKDIKFIKINNKDIIQISVSQAKYNDVPVFLKGDPKKAYIREGERDSLASREELVNMIKNTEETDNFDLLDGFSVKDDLKLIDVQNYKALIYEQTQNEAFLNMDIPEFLFNIGLIKKDRKDGKKKITKAALLLFGKFNSIVEVYHSFLLDFIIKSNSTDADYIDRIVTSNAPNSPENIFGFYTAVSNKINSLIDNKFELSGLVRKDNGEKLIVILREALVNCLVHADYRSKLPTKITFLNDKIIFENAGKMLAPVDEFFLNTGSVTRNDLIFQIFMIAKIGEHTGSGGYRIKNNSDQMKLLTPKIDTSYQKTKLIIWKITEEDIIKTLPEKWQETYKIISEKLIVKYKDLEHLYKNRYEGRNILSAMIDKGLIEKTGKNKGTRYSIPVSSPTGRKIISDYINGLQKL